MYHFRDRDKPWFNMYKVGDTIVFDNEKCTDRLIVTRHTIWDDSDRIIANEGVLFENYHAMAQIEGIFYHMNRAIDFWYFVVRGNDSVDVRLSMNIGNHYSFHIKNKENFQNGIYNDTVIFDTLCYEPGERGDSPLEVEWLKWKKGKGIVAYKLSDGTLFDDSK